MKHNKYLHLFNPVILAIAGILILIFVLLLPNKATKVVMADENHSHFRFGHIYWEADESGPANTAKITFVAGFRRSDEPPSLPCMNPLTGSSVPCSGPNGRPGVGDTVYEQVGGTSINDFGDGASTSTLYFKVFAIDEINDWVKGLQPDAEFNIPAYVDWRGPWSQEQWIRSSSLIPIMLLLFMIL